MRAYLTRLRVVPLLLSLCAASALLPGLGYGKADAEAPEQAAGTATQIIPRRNGLELRRGPLVMQVAALTDQIVRVRIGRDGALPEDASWAVPADARAHSVAVRPAPNGFATSALKVLVDPATLALRVEDLQGRTISADAPVPFTFDGHGFALRKQLPLREHVYGLGDKTGDFDRRGQSFVDWNTDAFAFMRSTDPIYKSIPFFIGVGGEGGSYGILFDNSWRAWFDFGHRDEAVTSFGSPDGPIDYYVIAGPSTAEVVHRYTDLTGKAPLPPEWALGYQQSRYSYMNEGEVRDVARHLRSADIPVDVIWLDIDYQDRNRPFTVDRKAFPDLAGLVSDMKQDGIRLIAITDLHVAAAANQGYAPYDSGAAGNHFVHNPDGSVFSGRVWPGASVFPDFSRAASRAWWGRQFKPFTDIGIAGFWNDMNEPSVFDVPSKTMPLDTVHRIESDDFAARDARHAEIHNVYGLLNSRATYEGMLALRPNERPFVMTRASYAGGQRYAVTWTGDNSATWDHLKLSVQQLVNLGLSGFSYAGADVGGFTGGPSPDLLTRWYEIGAFTPVFRNHAMKGTPRAEPWVDGPEHLAIRRRFIEERYRLLPYFYALADLNSRTGDPIMRPVFYDYPDAINAACDQSMAFTVGRSLLVAPPPKPESPQGYDVCLPAGGWYDYWTGLPVGQMSARPAQALASAAQTVAGPAAASEVIAETPKLDRLPVFVRAGTILPRQPLVRSTSETPKGPLFLDVYPGRDCSGLVYADDGASLDYRRAGFARQTVRCTVTAEGLDIDFAPREGALRPWWRSIAVTVHGWNGPAVAAGKPGALVPGSISPDDLARTFTFTIPDPARGGHITIVHRDARAARSATRTNVFVRREPNSHDTSPKSKGRNNEAL